MFPRGLWLPVVEWLEVVVCAGGRIDVDVVCANAALIRALRSGETEKGDQDNTHPNLSPKT